jgi:ABC-type sugar transport system substrate-binding protein
LVRIFSASATASMRQISLLETAAAAGAAVVPIAPPTTAAAPAAITKLRRDTPSSAKDVPVMGFPP